MEDKLKSFLNQRKVIQLIKKNARRFNKYFLLLFIFANNLFPQNDSSTNSEIEVLLSSNNSIYLNTLQSIQSASKKKLSLNFTNSMDESERTNFFLALEKKKVPFLVTLGPQATLLAKENLVNTPILYSLLNSPRVLGFNFTSNSCGVHIDVPIQEIFRTLKEINPSAKKVASIFTSIAGESVVNESDYIDSQFGIVFQKIKLENKEDFSKKLNSLKGKIDAFYIVPDSIYTQENFELLSDFSKENKIILMTQIPFIVNIGTTFSLTPYYARVGSFIGDMINEILSGKSECKDGYASSVKEFSFNLNVSYSKESGISLPKNIIKRAENSRLLIEGIQFYEKENYEVSNLVMQKIIKEDPTNPTANFYKTAINQKLNGEKIAGFLARAKEFKTSGNYKKERDFYKEVLNLQPDNQVAKAGFQESLHLESELERQDGERLELNNNHFAAIQKYINSIRILDSNTKAKADLNELRQKEIKNIPNYIGSGKNFYESRKYKESEEIFENVLLVEPENKIAVEYLRLSTKKKIAMQKYEDCIKNADKKCYLLWNKK